MSRSGIAQADNLFDFFHRSVQAAALRQGSAVSEESCYYLSNLLVERGREPDERSAQPGTLVELYQQAQAGPPAQTVRSYREIGDRALYVMGFFHQSLRRGLVSQGYYVEMGATAYARLSRLLRGPRPEPRGLDEVFAELGNRFEECTEILRDVHDEVRTAEGCSDADVLRLYEEWLATGSPRVAARLRELGVIPLRSAAAPGEDATG